MAVVGGIVVLGWVVAPVIDMIRHGTCDQRTVRGWRSESQRDETATEDSDDVAIPRQRGMAPEADASDLAEEIPPGRVSPGGDR
ncbi:hypothetical protein PHK61_20910 [Actinomycetospora lutea]|uniref:hypothetical protein n=1 Tax=Actinomycetospora lutea TaxID=663604 RepID=UPI002366AABD|nr:hypothetical protein [Actinomycetospora lutea]MDD7940888.1 hypothetical protein [Actinomycetospora lutea]